MAGTVKVFQKMLSGSRVMVNNLVGAVCLAGTRKIRAVLRRMMVSESSNTFSSNTFSSNTFSLEEKEKILNF